MAKNPSPDKACTSVKEASDEPAYTIRVVKDGPLLVTGQVTLRKATIVHKDLDHYVYRDDGIIPHEDKFILCRCGKSPIQPFCDRMAHHGWDGTETLWDEPFENRAKVYAGNGLVLYDDYDMCCLARFCHTDRGKIWQLMECEDDPEVARSWSRTIPTRSSCWRTQATSAPAPSGRAATSDSSPRTATSTRSAPNTRSAAAAGRASSPSATAATTTCIGMPRPPRPAPPSSGTRVLSSGAFK